MFDSIDLRLLKELQIDASKSNVELAKSLSMAESTVRRRIKQLVSKKIIRIAALLDPYQIGYGFISMMGLQVRMADLYEVAKKLVQHPNIYYLAFVTGRYDMLALILCRTPDELSNIIKEDISTIPSVMRTETFVNLEIIKSPWLETVDIYKLLEVNKTWEHFSK